MAKAGKNLILFQMFFLLFSGLLISMGLPHSILYLTDVVNGALLLCLLFYGKWERLKPAKTVLAAMGLWLGYMVISTLFKGPSLLWILWALRNWARGFVLFCGCFVFLDYEDLRKLLRPLKIIYVLNFLLICAEYLWMGIKGDYLGGIFGSEVGCNGQNNIFISLALILALCRNYRENRLTPFSVFVMFSSMVIAALEEIKVFFYVYLVIVAAVTILYAVRRQVKPAVLFQTLLCAVAAFAIGLWILYLVFPLHFYVLIGKKSIVDYEELSRKDYKISRTRFIPEINDLFFHGSVPLNLTGLGLGNCDYSRFDFLVSDFYRQHGDMNYLFFSHQPLYLEGGILGLAFFTGIPLVFGAEHGLALLRGKKNDTGHILGLLFGAFLILSIFYNNVFRTDISYLIYFSMAAAYIISGKEMTSCGANGR